MNGYTTIGVTKKNAASISKPIGRYGLRLVHTCRACKSLVVHNAIELPLEVFRDKANHTSHVALKDTTGADLRCDDLSNDGVEGRRSAA
jgi:hypothetical protein